MKTRSGPKIRIGISSCLLGMTVRYDGGHKLDPFLSRTLGPQVRLVPLCPEVGCGMPVPREPMHLVGTPSTPRLVTVDTGRDRTARLTTWGGKKLTELDRLDLDGFVFKCRSPSCGLRDVKVVTSRGKSAGTGPGLFARMVLRRFPLVPVEDEERLHEPLLRDAFIERLFVLRRWRKFLRTDGTRAGLQRFHEDHRLQVMAQGKADLAQMERLLLSARRFTLPSLLDRYGLLLTATFRTGASKASRSVVLRHALSRLRALVGKDDLLELRQAIELFRQGQAPFLVPATLLLHHSRRSGATDLLRQHFLALDPREIALRFHA